MEGFESLSLLLSLTEDRDLIFIDRREKGMGVQPGEPKNPFHNLGVPITVTELEFGDAMWVGKGPGGKEVIVGVERKRIGDLVNSMRSQRLSGHQLRGLNQSYDVVYLVVEGVWRPGSGGEIETYAGKTKGWVPLYADVDRNAVKYKQVVSYLNSLSLMARTMSGEPWRVVHTSYPTDTASLYATYYEWWQKESHKSADQIYCGDMPAKGKPEDGYAPNDEFVMGRVGMGVFKPEAQKAPSTLWRMAKQLPGVDERARQVATHFGTVRKMVLAGLPEEKRQEIEDWFAENPKAQEKAWKAVEGIGAKTAAVVVRAIAEKGM